MKKLIGLIMGLVIATTSFAASYSFTDSEYDAIDQVEEKIFDLMERKGWTSDFIVQALQQVANQSLLSERARAILDLIIEDIIYFGENGEYGDEWIMSAEDCYTDENYSEEDKRCYPIVGEEEIDYSSDGSHENKNHDKELKILTTYSIHKDNLTLLDGAPDTHHTKIRTLFSRITPPETRPFLVEIGFADDIQNYTDAYVEQATTPDTRRIVFNLASFREETTDLSVQKETMIHEYAHLLSYGPSQVNYVDLDLDDETWERYAQECKTFFEGEGCLKEDSYMIDFITQFWDEEELEITQEYGEPDNYTEEEYITEYAATNHGEDFAESFAFYVLKAKPTNSTTERDQKMLFFYDYPELVNLRNLIRSRLE